MGDKQDAVAVLTESIIADLEAGHMPPWQKPWTADASAPRNALTGKPYRGLNVWLLLVTSMSRGYGDPRWLTFKQAQERGGSVRKGEKSTPIIFWKPREARIVENENGEQELHERGMMLRYYRVFNVEQTDGVRLAPLPEPGPEHDPIEAAEAILRDYPNPPVVRWDGQDACYMPTRDTIHMPLLSSFTSAEAAYSTLNHELTHSTGNEKRLNRDGVTEAVHFGSDRYGREELVAEMGAAILNAHCGIAPATIENSTAYLASWLRTIKQEPRILITAAAQAQKAADHILGRDAA